LDDVADQYTTPPSRQLADFDRPAGEGKKGFVVKGGPWEQREQQAVPDTSDAQEFPSFCSEATASETSSADNGSRSAPWGPKSTR
jgi:hypothetical protein